MSVQLKKVTLAYSPLEDRIRMTAERNDGNPQGYWLTMRMSSQLVRTVCRQLEQNDNEGSQARLDQGTRHAVQQQAAEWQHKPSEPVQVSREVPMITPASIDVAFSADRTALLFPVEKDSKASLQMNRTELRQWLSILYRMFRNAGWPLDAWPAWFSGRNVSHN